MAGLFVQRRTRSKDAHWGRRTKGNIQGVPKKRSIRHCSTHHGSIISNLWNISNRVISINIKFKNWRSHYSLKLEILGLVEFINLNFTVLGNFIRVWKNENFLKRNPNSISSLLSTTIKGHKNVMLGLFMESGRFHKAPWNDSLL